jgi:hypothetical protein
MNHHGRVAHGPGGLCWRIQIHCHHDDPDDHSGQNYEYPSLHFGKCRPSLVTPPLVCSQT